MMEDVILAEQNVTVTRSRFQVPGQTYAINGVTSVKTLEEKATKWPAIALLVVGVFVVLGSFGAGDAGGIITGVVVGGLMAVGGYFWFKSLKSTWHVVLHSSSGEQQALSTKDASFLGRVVEAINKALIARG